MTIVACQHSEPIRFRNKWMYCESGVRCFEDGASFLIEWRNDFDIFFICTVYSKLYKVLSLLIVASNISSGLFFQINKVCNISAIISPHSLAFHIPWRFFVCVTMENIHYFLKWPPKKTKWWMKKYIHPFRLMKRMQASIQWLWYTNI